MRADSRNMSVAFTTSKKASDASARVHLMLNVCPSTKRSYSHLDFTRRMIYNRFINKETWCLPLWGRHSARSSRTAIQLGLFLLPDFIFQSAQKADTMSRNHSCGYKNQYLRLNISCCTRIVKSFIFLIACKRRKLRKRCKRIKRVKLCKRCKHMPSIV